VTHLVKNQTKPKADFIKRMCPFTDSKASLYYLRCNSVCYQLYK